YPGLTNGRPSRLRFDRDVEDTPAFTLELPQPLDEVSPDEVGGDCNRLPLTRRPCRDCLLVLAIKSEFGKSPISVGASRTVLSLPEGPKLAHSGPNVAEGAFLSLTR